jgi:hypothetical protein
MRILAPLITLAVGGLITGAALLAQDAMPPMPKPTPEHAALESRVGTWDADFTMHMEGQPDTKDKATMIYSMVGDFWLVGEYRGKFMDADFTGRELTTYDPEKKQILSYWIDSMSPMITEMTGTIDLASKTISTKSTQVDPMSGVKKLGKTVMKDRDTIEFTMTPEGQTKPSMEITYTRKK